MIRTLARTTGACIALFTALSWATTSYGQDSESAPTRTTYLAPNGGGVVEEVPADADHGGPSAATASALIFSGVVTLGLSYIPAVTVAGQSPLSFDNHLYVPVVGPWLDLGTRPTCGMGGVSCTDETTNKALLVADGFFQAMGVVQILAGLAALSHEPPVSTAKVVTKPSVRMTPAQLAAGAYGVAAFGNF